MDNNTDQSANPDGCSHYDAQRIEAAADALTKEHLVQKCEDCESKSGNSICVTCHKIFCASHIDAHVDGAKHFVRFNFKDGSFWCTQ